MVLDKIQEINIKKKSLVSKEEEREEIKNRKEEINKEIKTKEENIKLLKNIKELKNKQELEQEKIKIKKSIVLDYENKIKKLENTKEVKNNKKIMPLCIFLIFIALSINLFAINKIVGLIAFFATIITTITVLVLKKRKKIEKEEIRNKEIKILEQNKKETEQKIEEEEIVLQKTIQSCKNEIALTFNIKDLNELFAEDTNSLGFQISTQERQLGNLKIDLNTIEIQEKNIIKDLEYKAELEEEIEKAEEEKQELLIEEKRIKLAQEALERAYLRMKNEITPKFTANLSKIASSISNNKYTNIKFNDTEGVLVELKNGEYVNSNRLSVGTIEQLYLSLRLSAFEEITNERIPIILDETFAYYDNERLKNILKYLNDNFKENQIIIFTCTEREKEIFNELNIDYNFIKLGE